MKFKAKIIIFLCGAVSAMFIGERIAHFQIQSWLADCPNCVMCILCEDYMKLRYAAIGMVVGGISTCIIIFLIPPSQEEKEQKLLEKRFLEKLKE